MEGSLQAVTSHSRGGGPQLRPHVSSVWWMLLVSTFFILSAHSQSLDFLVVQNTGHLVIYDSFQQFLPPSQGIAIQPFAPMKILAQRQLLGDGLTPCMRVEVDGEVFYLLRDESGRLSGWRDLGFVKTYSRSQFVGDTVDIVRPDGMVIESPAGNGSTRLRAGDRLIRYFGEGGKTYGRRLGPKPVYGWLTLPKYGQGSSWKVYRPEGIRTGLSRMVRDRVVTRIAEVNATFTEVYSILGKETGKNLPIPQWSIDSSDVYLACVLRPATSLRFYPRAFDGLATELQAYLAGSGYSIHTVGNRIEIRKQ